MLVRAALVLITLLLVACCVISIRDAAKQKKTTDTVQSVLLVIVTVLIGIGSFLSSNPGTFNIIVPEISELSKKNDQLNKKVDELEEKVIEKDNEIENKDEKLKELRASTKNNAEYLDYKMYLNDDEVLIDTSNSIAKINEKLFFSQDVLESITKGSLNEDEENKLLYIGKYPEEYVDLLSVCEPYDPENGFELAKENPFKIQSITYSNGIRLDAYYANASTVKFNLGGKYSQLSFNIGHIDDTELDNTFTLRIYVDKNPVKEIICNSNMDINEEWVVPLNKGNTLEFEWICDTTPGNYSASYGLINLHLK